MTIVEAIESLKFSDQFKVVQREIAQLREDTIRDLITAPPDAQATLTGKLAAYQEMNELFTS